MSQDLSALDLEGLYVRVSYHAVTRYVQRVLGITVHDLPPSTTNKKGALAHCVAAGLSLQDVRKRIMTEHVARMMLAGFSRASTPDFTASLNPRDQVIRTILPPPSKRKQRTKRCVDRTRRESAKMARLNARKNKGRPSQKLPPKEIEP